MGIEWKPSMSVGDEKLDSQHKQIISQINILMDAITFRKEQKIIGETMDFLRNYIADHLAFEEQYMQKHGFPGLAEHKKIHKSFVEFFSGLEEEVSSAKVSGQPMGKLPREMAYKVQKFLGKWWINHIGKADYQYYKFIKEKDPKY